MGLLFLCFVIAGIVVKKAGAVRDRAAAAMGSDHAKLRMQARQHEHERWLAKQKHLHELRKAGKAGPTLPEALAERVRNGPKSRSDMGGIRAWWFDLCADRADQLTRERRAREERRRNGDQEWQKAARGFHAWWVRAGEQAARRWQERNEQRDPQRWTAERLDQDPTERTAPEPQPETVDAEFVDDQPQTTEPLQIEPGWPGDTPTPQPQPASTTPPTTTGSGWEAPREPFINGGQRLDRSELLQGSDNNGGTAMATENAAGELASLNAEIERQIEGGFSPDRDNVNRRDRLEKLVKLGEANRGGGWSPAGEHASDTRRVAAARDNIRNGNHGGSSGGGVPAVIGGGSPVVASGAGEIFNPESALANAQFSEQFGAAAMDRFQKLTQECASLATQYETWASQVDHSGVKGQPLADYRNMADQLRAMQESAQQLVAASDSVRGAGASAAGHFARHQDVLTPVLDDQTMGHAGYAGMKLPG
ncbi:MAG TPA: hypothetical protein VGJ13_04850 [Pseudonocardiaceae bacterium]|jgi:hypothetical protein